MTLAAELNPHKTELNPYKAVEAASVGEFFTRHSLHAGDQVAIERLAAREYCHLPLQEAGTP